MVSSVRLLSLNSATQESGNQEGTFQLVCLLLMTKPFGLFIWTVLQDPDGLLILFTLLRWPSIFHTQVLQHMSWKSKMQHSCVTARNENLTLNSRSVYYSGLQPGLFVQECLYQRIHQVKKNRSFRRAFSHSSIR